MFDRFADNPAFKMFSKEFDRLTDNPAVKALSELYEREYQMLIQYFYDIGGYHIAEYLENNKKYIKPLLIAFLAVIAAVGDVAKAIASFPMTVWWMILEPSIKKEINWIRNNPGKATLKYTATGLHLVMPGHGSILLLLAQQGASKIAESLLGSDEVKEMLDAAKDAKEIIEIVQYLLEQSDAINN